MAVFRLNAKCAWLKIIITGFIFLLLTQVASADTYDWLGGTSTDVTVASNWWDRTTSATGVPGAGDDVDIAVHSSYNYWIIFPILQGTQTITLTRMPVVSTNITWKTLTFGYFGPLAAYAFGQKESISITVNTNTLTVTGNVTQNHNPSAAGSSFNYILTTIAGTGTMLCQGNFVVGDAVTQPGNSVADVSQVSSQITQLTITGNMLMNSNGNNGAGGINGICYPYFSVEKGTTTLLKQLTFATNNSPLADSYDTYNPPLTTYPGYGKFTADNTAASPSTVELKYKQPIVPADKFYVYFTYGGNNGTVLYDDPTAENQTIYTANEPSATTSLTYINTTAPPYYNLTFAGASTKLVDKNSAIGATTQGLVVGNNWTTGGGTVDLNTNNPTVTVTGTWANSANVTQGSGNISVTNILQNNGNTITLGTGTLTVGSNTQINSGTIAAASGTVTLNGAFQNNGGTLHCGSGSMIFKGSYTNSSTFTAGTGTVFFSGASQALIDNGATGTTFNNVTFNGTGSATMSAGVGNFAVSNTGILTMVSPAKLVAGTTASPGGASYLTLNSGSTGTAAVAAVTGSSSITGNVNAQRFLTGGSTVSGGRWVYRNYRLMSSPVNAGLVSGQYPYTINYIAASAIVSGAKSSFGTLGGNPTIYVYSEDYTPSNAGFTTGNFKGVTDISTLTSPYTLAITSNGTTKALYVGNGFMFFFRGDKINSVGTSPGKTTYPYVAPENVVFTATGFLNQGSYTVNNWQTGSGLLYTTVAGNSAIQGFNLVGNPYASVIDWEAVNSGGIVATNLNPSIYVFNPVTNQYNTYSSSTHVGNPVAFTGKIASGEGFYVKANNTSPSLVFNEAAKSPTTVINAASGNLMMGKPAGLAATQQLFRLRLTIDSLNYDDIAIGFKSTASAKYFVAEDSKYLVGLSAAEGLASYSADSIPEQLSINFLPLPKQDPLVIRLNVTAKSSGRLTLEKTQLDSLPKIYELWLMDKYKKDSLDIRNNATYAFDVDLNDSTSFGGNRFELVIRQNKALGIHLLDFKAEKTTAGVQTTLKVENEENYSNFTVERSTDNGVTYSVLGGFASNSQGTYTFTDSNPLNAVDIYRIKIEDLNGSITYTKAIAINYTAGTGLTASSNINVYPNPAAGVINLSINRPESAAHNLQYVAANQIIAAAGNYSIKIVSISGTIVKSVNSTQPTWQGDVSNLQPGTYILQVLDNKDKSLVGKTTFVKL